VVPPSPLTLQASSSYALVTTDRLIIVPTDHRAGRAERAPSVAVVPWRQIVLTSICTTEWTTLFFKEEKKKTAIGIVVTGRSSRPASGGVFKRVLGLFDQPGLTMVLPDAADATALRELIKLRAPRARHHLPETRHA